MGIQGNWDERRLLNRRDFLGLGGLSAAAILLGTGSVTSNRALARPVFFDDPFKLGVASGDPLPDGVVLWTRLTPDPLAADGRGGMPPEELGVRWEVATDDGFRNVVRKGTATATPELGHSVHPEVRGLLPGREYFYRFKVGPEVSPVGRTKTAPALGSAVDRLTFALASCQAWAGGPYAAYRNMALEALDLVVHVGDYTYEGRDTETLADFRLIHARYKTSPDLRAAHAAFPFVVTFDDHEVENNWADEISQPDNDLKAGFDDPDSETIATEFVGTSISSGCPWAPTVAAALSANLHVKFFDGSLRGYVRCELTPGQWRSDYRVVPSATDPSAPASTLSSWVVENGQPGALPA